MAMGSGGVGMAPNHSESPLTKFHLKRNASSQNVTQNPLIQDIMSQNYRKLAMA